MADPSGLATPHALWLALVALATISAVIVLTVGASRGAPIDDQMFQVGLTTCEQYGAPAPVLCAAQVARGWTAVKAGEQLRLVRPGAPG